jgi:hypothetical protein
MNDSRKIALSILFVVTAMTASDLAERLDLKKLLGDSAALDKLVIEYRPTDNSVLFVYGTGRVVTQAHPKIGSSELVPTCVGKIDQAEVRGLVQEMINHRFFDLPPNEYYFITASDDGDDFWRALKLHSITIDDGHSRASRQFADGTYQDKKQAIPADFAAIEEILMRMEKSAIGDKPCHIAPGINLPFRRNQTMSSSSPA